MLASLVDTSRVKSVFLEDNIMKIDTNHLKMKMLMLHFCEEKKNEERSLGRDQCFKWIA